MSRAAAAARTLVAACVSGTIARRRRRGATELVASAWDAWRAGDVARAREQSGLAIQRGESADAARHVLALAAHVAGDHADAIAARDAIGARYRRLSELDEPILWSHLRLGDVAARARLRRTARPLA